MVTIKAHTRKSRKGKSVAVRSYKQTRSKHRGLTPTKKYQRPSNNVLDTYWLKDAKGEFTGRANRKGDTSSNSHIMGGKDDTGNLAEKNKYGRLYGRYKSRKNRGIKGHGTKPIKVKKGSPIR